jgi:hypothetical protein
MMILIIMIGTNGKTKGKIDVKSNIWYKEKHYSQLANNTQ